MPAAVIGSIGAAAGWTAATIATVTAVTQVVLFVGGLAYSAHERNRAKKKARDEYNSAQVDRMENSVTTVGPRDLVLGRVRKGGAVYFRGSAGSYRDKFLAHIALAGHEIDAVEQIYLNDTLVSLDSDGNVITEPFYQRRKVSHRQAISIGQTELTLDADPIEGTVTVFHHTSDNPEDSQHTTLSYTLAGRTLTLAEAITSGSITVSFQRWDGTSYAKIWTELGNPATAADSRTRDLFPDLWTADHKAQGVARLMAEFTYNETAFPNGVPAITAVIRGAKVYDPRTSLTAWSENPALLARHVYQHSHFGKATVSADEDARFIAAANACDVAHPYVIAGGTDTQNLYRAALVVPFGAPARSALDDLCQAMAGMWAFAGGELYIKAGVYTAPVMTLTDSDLAVVQHKEGGEDQDPISIAVHRERAEKFNVVNARIWNAAQQYKQVALTPYKSTALITRDGEELAQEMDMPAVFFAPQAQHVAGVSLRDARDPLTFEAPWKMRAYPLEIFDTVQVTLTRYGWSSKTFVVLSRVWDRERGVIRLSMKETAAAIFTPDAAFDAQGYADNTALPHPYDIEPPVLSSGTVSSGTDELLALADGSYQTRVHVTWPAIEDVRITSEGRIELQWQVVGTTVWNSLTLNGSDAEVYLTGLVDGTAILLRARSRTSMAVSDWCAQVAHIVVGKSEPPSAPTGVALTPEYVVFTPSEDIDVKGYRILYNVGSNTVRSVATQLHTGLVSGSPWRLPVRLYGINTVIVVTVDASGNESAGGTDTQDLGPPEVANVADEFDFVAEGYPGTITNGTVTGGVLLANEDGSVSFYGSGSGSDIYYRDGAADIYGGTQYLSLTYTCIYDCPHADGILLLESDIDGPRSTIEVRIDGSVIGDVYDTARSDIYGTDIASIYGTPAEFRQWNGSLLPTSGEVGYEFRITVDAGSVQGAVNQFEVRTEMPQLEQVFGSVAIAAAGTVIDPANGLPPRTFLSIEDVQVTPIGAEAVAGRVKTFPIDPETGPTVELINSSGIAVDGTAFVRVSGY